MAVIAAADCVALSCGTYLSVTDENDALVCLVDMPTLAVATEVLRRLFKRGWCHRRTPARYRIQVYSEGFPQRHPMNLDEDGLRRILALYHASGEVIAKILPAKQGAAVIDLQRWREKAERELKHAG